MFLRLLEHHLTCPDAGPVAAPVCVAQVLLSCVAGSVGADAAMGTVMLSHVGGEAAVPDFHNSRFVTMFYF